MVPLLRSPMTDIPQTRQSLLLELARRSDDAWAEFLHVYENAIYRQCRAKGLQDADARDVTQEVLAAVHERVASWEHDPSRGSFRAWLMRVARNISIDRITERARRRSGDSQSERALEDLPAGTESEVEFDLEVRRALFGWAARRVQSEVREATWRAFELTAVEGLSAQQAAERLQIPTGSVYTAKCRVVARIRARIDELGGEPGLHPPFATHSED